MGTIYNTSTKEGVDINSVFILSTGTPEYPRPPFLPGELAWGTDGSEWVYVTASVSIPAGSVLIISPVPGSWSVALAGGASVASASVLTGLLVSVSGGGTGSVAVPAPASPQTGTYFWTQRAGNAPNVNVDGTAAAYIALHSSPTKAGDVTTTAGGVGTSFLINGIYISQAAGSTAGPNTAVLNYPTVGIAG